MSMIEAFCDRCRVYGQAIGASKEVIGRIISFSALSVPEDYIRLLKEATDVQIEIDNSKDIMIWNVERCIEMNEAYGMQQYIPESLAIGDDGCGNALIYAMGRGGFGLYVVALNDLDYEELQYIAASLSELLIDGRGIDVMIDC